MKDRLRPQGQERVTLREAHRHALRSEVLRVTKGHGREQVLDQIEPVEAALVPRHSLVL